jgi:hypothetical protein
MIIAPKTDIVAVRTVLIETNSEYYLNKIEIYISSSDASVIKAGKILVDIIECSASANVI